MAVLATMAAVGTLSVSRQPVLPITPVHAADQTLYVARDITDAKSLDPGHFYEYTSEAVSPNFYDTLVTFRGNDSQHAVPDLATSWTIGGGGKVYTFHLRHGVRFVSGNPMTAADVVFSYRRFLYLGDNPSFLIAGATDIRALDPYTVQITLGVPDVSFLAALADSNFGVLDSKVVIAHGGDDSPAAKTKDKAQAFLDSQSEGTAPFQLTNWTRGVQIVLTRNPNYWGPAPSLKQIIFTQVADSASQALQVQKGSVDVALNINLQQAQSLAHNPNVQVVKGNTLDLSYLAITTNPAISKPLADKRVRQAIRYAIDYDGIIKGLLKGVGTQPNSMIPVGMVGNDPAFNNSILIHQNVQKAKALLTAAGYANGFSVPLDYVGGDTFDGISYDPLAAKIQNDLAQVGIRVTLVPQTGSVALAAFGGKKDAIILYKWTVDYPDPNDYAGPFSPGGGVAATMFYTFDKNLATLATEADSTEDTAKRAAIYHTIQKTWLDESPWVGLVQPQNIVVLGSNIKGYVYSPVLPYKFTTVSKD
jgi:peptide/nickel transport system substrate-binding protein